MSIGESVLSITSMYQALIPYYTISGTQLEKYSILGMSSFLTEQWCNVGFHQNRLLYVIFAMWEFHCDGQ